MIILIENLPTYFEPKVHLDRFSCFRKKDALKIKNLIKTINIVIFPNILHWLLDHYSSTLSPATITPEQISTYTHLYKYSQIHCQNAIRPDSWFRHKAECSNTLRVFKLKIFCFSYDITAYNLRVSYTLPTWHACHMF